MWWVYKKWKWSIPMFVHGYLSNCTFYWYVSDIIINGFGEEKLQKKKNQLLIIK